MANLSPHGAAMLGGTFCSIFFQLSFSDLIHIAILAAIGAIVSYGITLLLRRFRK